MRQQIIAQVIERARCLTMAGIFVVGAQGLAVDALDLPSGAEEAAKGALRQFLGGVQDARADFGFTPQDDLSLLKLEKPFPASTLDAARLGSAQSIESVEEFINPISRAWFPVSLNGKWRGLVTIVRASSGDRWLPEGFSHRRLATVLEIYRERYPLPDYVLQVVLPSALPHANCLVIHGLGYSNLTVLPNDPAAAARLAKKPPKARAVLETLRAQAH